MPTILIAHGHSCFEIVTAKKRLLIDPFFTDNPLADCKAEDVSPDVILLTHGHFDHVGDVVSIAKRTSALVIANFEITDWLGKQGVANVHAMHIGGAHKFDFGTVKLTIAHHGSMLPDGSNGGNPAGILLKLADGTIYHAGDTGLFLDMQLIGEAGIDIAILPIGDNYTMGPDDALRAVQFLKPKRAIPVHYNTWPPIAQNADEWARRVTAETSAEGLVLTAGESCTLGT